MSDEHEHKTAEWEQTAEEDFEIAHQRFQDALTAERSVAEPPTPVEAAMFWQQTAIFAQMRATHFQQQEQERRQAARDQVLLSALNELGNRFDKAGLDDVAHSLSVTVMGLRNSLDSHAAALRESAGVVR